MIFFSFCVLGVLGFGCACAYDILGAELLGLVVRESGWKGWKLNLFFKKIGVDSENH